MLKYVMLILAILVNFVALFLNDVRSWEFAVSVIWIALLSAILFFSIWLDRSDKNE